MTEAARNFVVGLATIIGLVGLAILLMYFGELRLFAKPEYQITIHLTAASGLREGAAVELNGVPIGRIESVWIHEEVAEFPVRARARVDRAYRIPTNVTASIDRALVAGTASLQLVAEPWIREDGEVRARPEYVPDDGEGQLWVRTRTLYDMILDELDRRTEPVMIALENFNRLSETYTQVGENLNALIGNSGLTDPDSPDAAEITEPNLRAAVAKLNAVLDEARSALHLASAWLEDDQLRQDVSHAVTNANALIDTATQTFERYRALAESLESDAAHLVQNLVPVTDELAATLEDVRRLTQLATEGRGTVAQLLNNPDLYESLLDASVRLERALTEAQLLIQKFQAEGVPVRW